MNFLLKRLCFPPILPMPFLTLIFRLTRHFTIVIDNFNEMNGNARMKPLLYKVKN